MYLKGLGRYLGSQNHSSYAPQSNMTAPELMDLWSSVAGRKDIYSGLTFNIKVYEQR